MRCVHTEEPVTGTMMMRMWAWHGELLGGSSATGDQLSTPASASSAVGTTASTE